MNLKIRKCGNLNMMKTGICNIYSPACPEAERRIKSVPLSFGEGLDEA